MDQVLGQIVADRLAADAGATDDVVDLVLAALHDEPTLQQALTGRPPRRPDFATTAPGGEPVGAYLQSVSVEGFRGIGRATRLEIGAGPGLTLVVGRNGSGKSSLAEGLEVLLTGESRRWAGRAQVWREGWRNLHHPSPTRITAEFAEEGHDGATVISRVWEEDAGLEAGVTAVQRPGEGPTEFSVLGWTDALDAYRPFLSYNELGSMLDEAPSKLYDAMAGILGLDEIVAAERRLGEVRRGWEKQSKDVAAALKPLLAQLQVIDDEHARACAKALSGRRPDLDAAEDALRGAATGEPPAAADGSLRALTTLGVPEDSRIAAVAQSLRQAAADVTKVQGTDADNARLTASILSAVVAVHDTQGDGDCIVCGRVDALDAKWHDAATEEIERLRQLAQAADVAHEALAAARREAVALFNDPSATLARASESGLDAATAAASRAWSDVAKIRDEEDPERLATALEDAGSRLAAALVAIRDEATVLLRDEGESWQTVAADLLAWIAAARADEQSARALPVVRKAERWLKDAAQDLRNERFAPIADEAARVWGSLRVQSNVELGAIELTGSATQRKVVLAVTVDGADGAALGVMSQGELHSLALSLFLPRATLPESPFRFLVIDDPVQSMDPARVDGLARVLEETAERRQVVVFTHDDRLPESTRRLGIDAAVIEVSRREDSVVELRPSLDPVARHLDDAYVLARAEGELPAKIARFVVPGFCRSALEAACAETVRRRRLARGERHSDVEDALAAVGSLTEWMALGLFDDDTRGADVLARLETLGPRATETFVACESRRDESYAGDLVQLVADTRVLTERLRGMTAGTSVLATVLFTDIVASSARATELGDQRWRTLLDQHRRVVAQNVTRGRGALIKETGDGVLATFDSPARAIGTAVAIREAVGRLGLQVRAGLHTGEIDHRGDDISGLAVVIARRVCDAADADRILVSRTVTDLVAGSGLQFTDRGTYELKGVAQSWQLFEVTTEPGVVY